MRVQLALNVENLDAAVDYYSKLFGAKVNKRKPGYANFAIDEPPLELVLLEVPGAAERLDHLGVEVFEQGRGRRDRAAFRRRHRRRRPRAAAAAADGLETRNLRGCGTRRSVISSAASSPEATACDALRSGWFRQPHSSSPPLCPVHTQPETAAQRERPSSRAT